MVGKYKLEEFIGAGRIGYVYRASHQDVPGASFAVKLIFDTIKDGWNVELSKVSQLTRVDGIPHFHLIENSSITHAGKTKLFQYTVWDYIAPGENLKTYLARVKAIPPTFFVAVIERILHVLHSCESTHNVKRHGDLHSGNILIGDPSDAILDDALQPRAPIYVSDFGYGASDGTKKPKDDYEGLISIINEMVDHVDYATATSTQRQIIIGVQNEIGKLLREKNGTERRPPLEILRALREIQQRAKMEIAKSTQTVFSSAQNTKTYSAEEAPTVGQFQVSEMIGDRWNWWLELFVPTVPARSKILALDIPTVVTGPRGCGKTMLFRRLSERLIVECGEIPELKASQRFVAFYVNANDFADAFARYPELPDAENESRLICYANLCILSDALAVQSARAGRMNEPPPDKLVALLKEWLARDTDISIIVGEDQLERYRALLEQIKWDFHSENGAPFAGYQRFSQHRWLPELIKQIRSCCPWMNGRTALLFIDDFSTPRVSRSMQRTLNRLFLQRSPEFLTKLATEAWTTFFPEDSSGKTLEDGDDYQLVDMGEESLFLPDEERSSFLNEVFSRRLRLDSRVAPEQASLIDVLGKLNLSKTEFARRLRTSISAKPSDFKRAPVASQRRGRSRARVEYFGEDVFSNLWSGDTRTMIQLISDVLDQASEATTFQASQSRIKLPVNPTIQDRAFRNRGGEWLNSHTRNEPTDPARMKEALGKLKIDSPDYKMSGEYGDHLKAIVEAFVSAATNLLIGPTYAIGKTREVPRMAFRLEIVDEFRIDGLAQEIYRDLIRYGLFMRDNRGKSVRGAFVPRLYLRRLLLPYCTLALSKRDSVSLSCEAFKSLLLEPDKFKAGLGKPKGAGSHKQIDLDFGDDTTPSDIAYNDLTADDLAPDQTGSDR